MLGLNNSNMSKRKYKITRNGEWFKVQVWNEYGHYNCVYEKDMFDASKHIIDWWEGGNKSHKLLEDAIYGCTKLDEELGLIKGNRDNLD